MKILFIIYGVSVLLMVAQSLRLFFWKKKRKKKNLNQMLAYLNESEQKEKWFGWFVLTFIPVFNSLTAFILVVRQMKKMATKKEKGELNGF